MPGQTSTDPANQLRQIVGEIDRLVVALRTGEALRGAALGRLELALQQAGDLLREVAMAPRTPEPRRSMLLLARDTVASHLRAAEEVLAAGGTPSSRTRLVVRAARELHLALDQDPSLSRRLGA